MKDTLIFVDQQMLLTIFLVVLLWSLHARLRKHDFFRWWAWAWTAFAGYLGIAAVVLRFDPAWSVLKGSLLMASLVCGFLQVPLLAFGASALREKGEPPRIWIRRGIAAAVAASILVFAAALYTREQPFTSFVVRTAPRTLALAVSLFFCASVFIGQWRRRQSLAAVIAAVFCSLYALDQSFYTLIFINQLAQALAAPFSLPHFRVLLAPLPLFLDLVFESGIGLSIVLLLVEEHQRKETALLESSVRERAIAETNVALQAEITERKRMEEVLRWKEGELKEAQRVAGLGNWLWDPKTDAFTWSEELYRIHGLDPMRPPPSGQEFKQLFTPESWIRLSAAREAGLQKGSVPELDLELVRPDGCRRWVTARGESVRDAAGLITCLRGTVQDITERKRAQEALQKSEEKFAKAFREGPVAVTLTSARDHRYLEVNETFEKMSGYLREEVIGHTGIEIGLWVDPSQRVKLLEDLHASGSVRNFQCLIRAKSGAVLTCLVSTELIEIDREPCVLAVTADITDLKQLEQKLRESQDRLAGIIETAMDAIIGVDDQQRIVLFNAAAEKMFIIPAGEAIGDSIDRLIPQRFRSAHSAHVRRFGETGVTHRALGAPDILWGLRANGEEFPIEASISHTGTDGKRLFIVIIRDITERLRAEEAVRESEKRFRLVADTAPVLIWMSGPDKLRNYVNQSWLAFTGRPVEAELGNGWAEGLHPEDLKVCLETYTRAFDGRESFKMQYQLRRHDGEYRWVLDIGVPRFNADGSFAGYIGSCIDVTDRKLAEEALSGVSRRLIEAHEEERAWIARELHDDVNQRIALLAIELGRVEQDLPASAAEVRRHIQETQEHISDLGHDIQALSHRLHSSKLKHLGLAVAARSFCKELSEQQKVEIEFIHAGIPLNLPQEIALCLFRVLQEALQNAVKHSGVRRFRAELRGELTAVELVVSDSGVGFDPKEAMNGRGLGIISMQERLNLVRGELSIESKPNCGATVRALVPLRSEEYLVNVAS